MLAKAIRYEDGIATPVQDTLAAEEVLQIIINRKPYTLTMRTPGEDEFLTKGLLFTEHIIEHKLDVTNYRVLSSGNRGPLENHDIDQHGIGTSVEVTLGSHCMDRQPLAGRTLLSSASCGMCGKTDVKQLPVPALPLTNTLKLDVGQLEAILQLTSAQQTLFHATGGCHAAAAFTIEGKPLAVMEDIGRHNAVDKVIGFLLEHELLALADLLHVSGRVSYEIVTKTHAARIPFLTSVSAPSSLAVRLCDQIGMTLISFCRGTKATVYTHPTTVIGAPHGLNELW